MTDNISGLFGHDENFNDTLKRFEDMLLSNKSVYFDVESFVEVADYMMHLHQYEKVRKILNIGLLQHPKSEELLLKKAFLHIINDNFEKAKHILMSLIKMTSANPDVYYNLGYLYVRAKDIKKAVRYYDSALSMSDTNQKVDFLYQIIDDLMDELEYSVAINYLHQLLEIDPYDFEAIMDLTSSYKEIGQDEKAIDLCNDFLDKDPFNELVWFQLGMLYEELDMFDKAIEAYEFAVAIEPEYSLALYSLGILYRTIELFERSNMNFLELLKTEPESAQSNIFIGKNYLDLEEPEEAMKYFETAVALDPTFSEAWFRIGEIYFDEHRFYESLLYTKKAIKYERDEPTYWYRLGKLLQILNHTQYAILAFKRVLTLEETNKKAMLHLAECYFKDKDFEKTISTCAKASELFNDSSFNFLYGATLLETEEHEKGINQIQLGLEKDKDAFDEFVYFYPKIISFDAVKKLVNKINKNKHQ